MENENETRNVIEEIVQLIRADVSDGELRAKLEDYHDSDIADAIELITGDERKKLYHILGAEKASDIFAYLEDPEEFIAELDIQSAAKIIENMDADDAVDVLEEVDEETQEKIISLMDDESSQDIKLIQSYEDDEIGSKMTTNFVKIRNNLTIKEAMIELIKQADEKLYYGKEHGRDQLVVTMDGAQPCYRMLLVFQQDEKRGNTMITFSDEILDSENPMQLFADIAMREAEQESLAEEEEDAPPADKKKEKDTEEKKDE